MQNILGEEVIVEPIRFNWLKPQDDYPQWHLWVFRGEKIICNVSPNGWNGYSINVYHKLGEPLMTNITGNGANPTLAFNDLQVIMTEFWSKVTPKEILNGVIKRLAEEKEMSIDETIQYITTKKIPFIST